MKHKLRKIGQGLLIAAAIYLVISFLITPLALHLIHRPRPIRNFSTSSQTYLESEMHITIPSSAEFVAGMRWPGRESTNIYILEVGLSSIEPEETVDQFVRRVFSISEFNYYSTGAIDKTSWTYEAIIEKFGNEFDCEINEISDIGAIYYSAIDENTLRVALIDQDF